MTGETLFKALNHIDIALIAEADELPVRSRKRAPARQLVVAFAACCCVLVGWAIFASTQNAAQPLDATTAGGTQSEEAAAEGGAADLDAGHGAALANTTGAVRAVTVTSLPESADTARYYTDPEKVKAVVEYLSGLHLRDNFPENPDDYEGQTLVLAFELENGTTRTFYHFGNMFLRAEDGDWKRMTYEEAIGLEKLLRQYESDEADE